MLDIKFVRENPELVKENIKKKFQDSKLLLVDEVIALDAEYRAAITEGDGLRAQRNKLSKSIGALMAQGKKDEAEAVKKQVTEQADRLKELEMREAELQEEVRQRMLVIPNMLDPVYPSAATTARMWRYSVLVSLLCRILKSPIIPRSWNALAVSTWTAPAVWRAMGSITCLGILPACMKPFWHMPGIL